jgi:phospholipase/carboxylesterase
VFIGAGRGDSIAPFAQAERLAAVLREAGADVALHAEPGGHAITPNEVKAAQRWLLEHAAAGAGRGARGEGRPLSPRAGDAGA